MNDKVSDIYIEIYPMIRWLSIDEILSNQISLLQKLNDREEALDNLAQALDEVLDLDLDVKMDKVDENFERLNMILLELKGVVAMARSSLNKSKAKSKKMKPSDLP